MQYKQYKKDFTRDEVAAEIAIVKKFMAEYSSKNNSGLVAIKEKLKEMRAKFSPEAKTYYDAVAAQIKEKVASKSKAISASKQEHFRACCQNPKGIPGVPCKCYQGAQKYIAAVKYVIADKKAA
jgi:hypothetical protein